MTPPNHVRNARALIVLGATFELRDQLKTLGLSPIYVDTPVDAMDAVLQDPEAVLAYGPGVFGAICAGQLVKVVSAHRSLVLISKPLPDPKPPVLKAGEFQSFQEDPESLARQAAVTLRAKLLLVLDEIPGRVALQELLLDMAPDYITNCLKTDTSGPLLVAPTEESNE
jgi:hypothetical protein